MKERKSAKAPKNPTPRQESKKRFSAGPAPKAPTALAAQHIAKQAFTKHHAFNV